MSAVEIFERGPRGVHQAIGREHTAAHEDAEQQHPEDKRKERRRHERHPIGDAQAAEQRNGQKEQRQDKSLRWRGVIFAS